MTSGSADSKELDNFLSRVDEINDIIKGLSQSDDRSTKDAIRRADAYIKNAVQDPSEKTGFSRTVINKAAFQDEATQLNMEPRISEGMSKDAFCAAIERDAAERSARRKEKMLVASKCKDEGNAFFKLGNFEEAVNAYTQGLAQIRDFKELYTNRAQAYIKLGRYNEALDDCNWALKVQAGNTKAYVIQGKAYLALKDYDKAIESYNHALQCDLQQEKTIKAYIREAELSRAAAEQEREAAELLASGARQQVTMAEALRRVKENGHELPYYRAALVVLEGLIQDDDCKSLFRTEGGFEMIQSHSLIARCLCAEDVSSEEVAVCDAFLAVLVKVCDQNESSQVKLLSLMVYRDKLMQFVNSVKLKKRMGTQLGIYRLLLSCSTSETGAGKLVSDLDCASLLNNALTIIVDQTRPALSRSRESLSLATCAVELLEILARHDRFKKKVSACMSNSHTLGALKMLLDTSSVQMPVLSIMTNLCSEYALRQAFAKSNDIVETTVGLLPPNDELKENEARIPAALADRTDLTLGLLMNVALVTEASPIEAAAGTLCRWCLCSCAQLRSGTHQAAGDVGKTTSVLQRSLTLLARLLRSRPELAGLLVEQGLLGGARAIVAAVTAHLAPAAMQDAAVTRGALAALACFTTRSESVRQELLADGKGLQAMFELLSSTDEAAVGNAALCLTHCLSAQPATGGGVQPAGAVRAATTPAVLRTLLPWARDAAKGDVRQNCAILVARLTQLDSEYLEELRRLEGLGILHSCMKLIR